MINVTIDIEEIIEGGFRQAFFPALEQIVQAKAEELVKKSLAPGSPLTKKLEAKIEQGFERFLQEGSRWEKKKGVFKKNH